MKKWRALLLVSIAPCAATLLGAYSLWSTTAAGSQALLQVLALCGGLLLAVLIVAASGLARHAALLLVATLGLVLLTWCCGESISILGPNGESASTTRWLVLGPLRLHTAELVMPGFALLLAHVMDRRDWQRRLALVAGLALVSIQIAQRDGGSAICATMACWVAVLMRGPTEEGFRPAVKLMWALGVTASCVIAVYVDPQPAPVPWVERAYHVAWRIHPGLAVAAGVTVAFSATAPFLLYHRRVTRPREEQVSKAPAGAMSAVLVAAALVPFFGSWPVPLVGGSPSWILGWFVGLGLMVHSEYERGVTLP